MTRSIERLCGVAALFLLAACGGGKNENAVGGVTAEEAAQLDNAAEMLDASPDSLTAPENAHLDMESGGGNAT